MNPSITQTPSPLPLPTNQWQGLQSTKFKGGRSHDNHPRDQLDSLLISSKSEQLPVEGKKQFQSEVKDSRPADFRPHMKMFEKKYKKSTVFAEETITKYQSFH